jgi:hypothetical protein
MLPNKAILRPIVALAVWTFVMWFWMYATRIPALIKAKLPLDRNAPRGEQMATLPANVRWKADNYNHLHEQPTVFFAVALVLALIDNSSGGIGVVLAWSYVGARVAHSLFQAINNQIKVRFALFVLSSMILLAMTFLTLVRLIG